MKKLKQQQPEALDARMTIRLPSALLKRLKHAAIEADSNLQGFVLEALMQIIEKEERR